MKKILLIAGILVLAFACEEQKLDIEKFGVLKGVILDGVDYTPIQGVAVATNPASSSVLTNADGVFILSKVLEGDIAVTAHKNDYLSNSVSAAIYEMDTTQVTFFLMKDENEVGWVEIYDPVPGNGAVNQNISFTMQWQVNQQHATKELTYTVIYFESNSTTQKTVGENITAKEVVISGLKYNTAYYWYVIAKYEGDFVANSPTWTFMTEEGVESVK